MCSVKYLPLAKRGRTTNAIINTTDEEVATRAAVQESNYNAKDITTSMVGHREDVIANSSELASIAADIDASIRNEADGIMKASGVTVTTAEIAEQFNAPARTQYNEQVNNPVVAENIKRYSNEVDVYSAKLDALKSDTSFLGGLKRMTLEKATTDRLNQARSNLTAANNRQVIATQTYTAVQKANNLYASDSTALTRAVIADGLVRAETATKLLQSGRNVTLADRQVLMDRLELDSTRLAEYEAEFKYLNSLGLGTRENLGSLQTKLHAQQSQSNAIKSKMDTQQKIGVTEDWHTFIRDNTEDDAEAEQFIRDNSDPFANTATATVRGQTFWKNRGQTGTTTQFAQLALNKREKQIQTDDKDNLALTLIDAGVSTAKATARNVRDQKIVSDPQNREQYEKEYAEQIEALKDPKTQSTFFAAGLEGMKTDATAAIKAGTILLPDLNKILTDPTYPYSKDISDDFKQVLTSDEWKSIDLSLSAGKDPLVSVMDTVDGAVDYLSKLGTTDSFGRLVMDASTQKRIDTVTQGLANYYTVLRTTNIKSGVGITSANLPAILLGGAGIGGTTMNLENKTHWDQAIHKMIQKSNKLSTLEQVRSGVQ